MSSPGSQLFQDARELIEIESITGNEAAVTDCLEEKVRALGLPVTSEEVAPGRRNLLAGRAGARVLFCTHTDTVPRFVPYREDGDYLYGRGACDAKGISATMLEAGRRLLARGIDDFGFLWLVGEETDHAGARKANETVRCTHLIVGKPTENQLALGHKGVIVARVRVRGRSAHSAYPYRGESAIHLLLPILERLQQMPFPADSILGPATVNIGRIRGGIASNVLAPHATAEVSVRVVGDLEETEMRMRICLIDPEILEDNPRITLRVVASMPRVLLDPVPGFPTTVVAHGTDIPFLRKVGRPYLIGPGDIQDAHRRGEKISRRQMIEAVDVYERLVCQLLGA